MNKWTRRLELSRASAEPAGAAAVAHHYFAFLSYSHGDSDEADRLHQELEEFRVPATLAGKLTATGVIPKRLTPIFRDRHDLAAGHDLSDEIRLALAASRCLIVLCSPAAARSKWTNAEIDAFKRLHPEGCIIAAVIAGEPMASLIKGREGEECFPPALLTRYDRRGRPTGRSAEPLAADLRDRQGGRRTGVLKVVAGVLGIGLDDLVQRDHLRRQRRLAYISAGSLAGMLVAIALAVTAITARDAARDQKREAESLISYMLGDLKDRLEPIGRLDALDGLGSRVLDYYHKQDASQLSDAGLRQRSSALSLTANVAYLKGDNANAERLYREAMVGTGEAVSRNGQDPERLFEHAQNVFWLGELARAGGRMAEAKESYAEYRRLSNRMVELDPNNLRWRMEVAYSNEDLGIVLFYERQFAQAAARFRGGLRPMENVSQVDADNVDYQREVVNVLGWLADAERAQGHLDQAIALRQRQVRLVEQFLLTRPSDVKLRERLLPANQGLGILFASRNQPERAIEQLTAAVNESDRLRRIEPDNVRWTAGAASAHLELAKTLLSFGREQEAAAQARDGCELVARADASNNTVARRAGTACLLVRARLASASGASADALALAARAVRSAATESKRVLFEDRYSVAAALRVLGDVRQKAGEREGALQTWRSALSQLPVKVAENPWEMYERASLLKRLNRSQEAEQIDARLRAIGFRGIS